MKVAVAFVLFLAGVMAMPSQPMPSVDDAVNEAFRYAVQTKDARIVDGIVEGIINNLIRRMEEAGLDHINVQQASASYAIVPDFTVYAEVEEFDLIGLTSIIIEDITFNLFTFTLRFNIYLDGVSASAAHAAAGASIDGYGIYGASVGGSASVSTIRFAGTARVGLIPSITIHDIDILVTIGGFSSDLAIRVLGADYSDQVNNFINVTLPAWLSNNSDTINNIVNTVIEWIIKTIL